MQNPLPALMQWMEQRPGETPPADTDLEVIEAVLAMRPDLAPPLRVDMAQILGQVSSGPLAPVKSNPNDLVSLVPFVRSAKIEKEWRSLSALACWQPQQQPHLFAIRITSDTPVFPQRMENAVEVAKAIEQVAPEEHLHPQSATGTQEAQNKQTKSSPQTHRSCQKIGHGRHHPKPQKELNPSRHQPVGTNPPLDSDIYGMPLAPCLQPISMASWPII